MVKQIFCSSLNSLGCLFTKIDIFWVNPIVFVEQKISLQLEQKNCNDTFFVQGSVFSLCEEIHKNTYLLILCEE
jgi:hypothetical protein